jgi:hypothetical protein
VLCALQTLAPDIIKWPDAQERIDIANEIGTLSSFSKCCGFLDGSFVPLEYRPTVHGSAYYTYKSRYALNTLAVVDAKKRFRYQHLGWVGCAHDSRVFAESDVRFARSC